MTVNRFIIPGSIAVVLLVAATAAFMTRDRWSPWLTALRSSSSPVEKKESPEVPQGEVKVLKLSAEARKNIGLVVKPVKLETYWRTIQVPGVIIDRPGVSDRGVTAPAVGAVAEVHAFPGDTVRPGERLFTLRVFSEYLQNTQSELFKAVRESELLTEQRDRLAKAAKSGAVAEARVIELDNQLRRQTAAISAYRQDLLTRGLTADQIAQVSEGTFISTIDVVAPPPLPPTQTDGEISPVALSEEADSKTSLAYEVQELKVSLGEQVQAGQVLCFLANHRVLYIEGHAFKQEAPYLERAAQGQWPVQVEFAEDDNVGWQTLEQTFEIRHLANSIDPKNRTFDFFIPLTNQSRSYQKDGQTHVVWRFRPGQRTRLHVPVDQLREAIVLPSAAVVREGPEAYVFRQNGDLFDRRPVQLLHEDRQNVVIAAGQVRTGMYIAQNGAATLNRVLKAQASSGMPAGVHVHADGTVHGAH